MSLDDKIRDIKGILRDLGCSLLGSTDLKENRPVCIDSLNSRVQSLQTDHENEREYKETVLKKEREIKELRDINRELIDRLQKNESEKNDFDMIRLRLKNKQLKREINQLKNEVERRPTNKCLVNVNNKVKEIEKVMKSMPKKPKKAKCPLLVSLSELLSTDDVLNSLKDLVRENKSIKEERKFISNLRGVLGPTQSLDKSYRKVKKILSSFNTLKKDQEILHKIMNLLDASSIQKLHEKVLNLLNSK